MRTKSFDIYKYLLVLCLGVVTSCSDDNNPVAVYMPQATTVLNVQFQISEDPYEVPYTVSLVGADFPTASVEGTGNDIEITFRVEPALVNTYNEGAGTDYTLLPEGTYTLDNTAIIPKGSTRAEMTLTVINQSVLQPFQSYVLPVSIENVSGASKGHYQQTLYFLVTATANADDMEAYDRANWTIDSFSSEEASGEGANNGHAIHSIDGDPDTFWHTQWMGSEPGPPHWIIIDMHASMLIHGLRLDPRNHWQGQPAVIKVEVSDDKVTWKNSGTIDDLMATQYGSENDLQHQEYSRMLDFFHTGRYLKITIIETMPDWNDPNGGRPNASHLAEVFAF
jgi:hypothetical protein